MNSKHVYFVRHGESVANATKIRQGPTGPLSERGRAQAICVAKRIAEIPIKRVIVSPHQRTAETAAAVVEKLTGIPVEYSQLVVERRNPSIMTKRSAADPEIERIWMEIAKNYHVPGWRHSDEENFEDLLVRAQEALGYIEKLPEENILVVSHGMFMKMVFAHVLLGNNLNARIFWDQFVPAKNVANTGIMHLEYTDNWWKTGKYWKLISWNDHAHLLDSPVLL